MSGPSPVRASTQAPRRRAWAIGVLLSLLVMAASAWHWLGTRAVSWDEIRASADQKRWDDAANGLEHWLRAHPQDDRAWLMLGAVHGMLQQPRPSLQTAPHILRRLIPTLARSVSFDVALVAPRRPDRAITLARSVSEGSSLNAFLAYASG